ncbi:MAG: PIN domain-containing protein [Chloroflexi bacterium]|nr:PIN domain-containing protein [Chloroflexota bacterium]
MSAHIDTSVVVRYLTGDPPSLADQAARILDGESDLLVTDVVLAETAYVLTSVYRVPRQVVVDHLIGFIQKENITVSGLDKATVIQALLLCRPSGRVSFADALVWSAARSAGVRTIYSFDERFPSDEVEVRRAPRGT